MKRVIEFVKKESVLSIAFLLAVASMFVVLPDAEYVTYIDYKTLDIKNMKYVFISSKKEKIKCLKDLENYNLILPIPGTNNRDLLDELLLKNEIVFNRVINIHTSELIIDSVEDNMGIGYVLEDLVKDNKDINILNIKEKLPIATLALIYNKKFLTSAPRKFIDEYIK